MSLWVTMIVPTTNERTMTVLTKLLVGRIHLLSSLWKRDRELFHNIDLWVFPTEKVLFKLRIPYKVFVSVFIMRRNPHPWACLIKDENSLCSKYLGITCNSKISTAVLWNILWNLYLHSIREACGLQQSFYTVASVYLLLVKVRRQGFVIPTISIIMICT